MPLSPPGATDAQFLDNGFDEVFPLWVISTVPRGGLDWTTKDIGQVRPIYCSSFNGRRASSRHPPKLRGVGDARLTLSLPY